MNDGVDARGTQRRIQALVARGWSMRRLAAILGRPFGDMPRTMAPGAKVSPKFAMQVRALFEAMWAADPPQATPHERSAVTRALRMARANGWVPPLAWDNIDTDDAPPAVPRGRLGVDEIAVALCVQGEVVRLTPAERRLAVPLLVAKEMNDREIAKLIGVDTRNVLRIRQDLGIPAAVGADRLPVRRAS